MKSLSPANANHDIEIPSLVVTKIAKEIEVKVKSTLRAS